MSLKALSDYTQYSKYALYDYDKKRRETWNEQIDRVFKMHEDKIGDKLEDIKEEFEFAKSMVLKKRVLGSQRALQFGGPPILTKNAKMYNCFIRDTSFITSDGVKSFKDYENGDKVKVLTHTGSWKEATVKSYGEQVVYPITFNKGKSKDNVVWATSDHTWILKDGTRTTSLTEGNQLFRQPNIFNDWDYNEATPEERLYWAYGLVYGDGTCVQDKNGVNKYSMIRLYGNDKQYAPRFEELGFKTSTNHSLNGDFYAYTGSYLKQLPNPEKDPINLLRAFVRGLLDADGEKNSNFNGTGSMFLTIQQSKKETQDFIRKVFPIVGVYVLSETPNERETNFGNHDSILFRISTSCEGSSSIWKVNNIDRTWNKKETVWCLEVEDDHSFVMPNGIVTGNCTVSYVDRPRFFQECMYLLLCGCGTGFSVQKHHIKKLPKVHPRTKGKKTFVIPDTIEGWADAIGALMSSYFDSEELFEVHGFGPVDCYSGYELDFDASMIREKGAPISWGGIAPGPEGLLNALEKIRLLMDRVVENGSTKLKPIDAYDVIMHSSDAVLSGGIRRSATICLFSPDDKEMATAKTGNWFETNPQRGRSNNSALLIRDETSKEQFAELMQSVREYGEPGFIWAEDKECLYNPCAEIGMRAYTEDGKSGWQFCNLCEMNVKKAKTEEDFIQMCEAAAVLGTIQATYDEFDYLTKETEAIVKKEALLGVSMTGMADNPDIAFNPEIQRKGAKAILKINDKLAPKLGINKCARATCVKPAGTTSCMLGTASGIHPHHALYYFRRVQANKGEYPAQLFKEINPLAVEESVWSANKTDWVITFLCEVPPGARTKNKVGAIDLLEMVKLTQQNWVEAGTRKGPDYIPWLRHNVSNTINVKPEEWEDVENFIYKNRKWFAGISLLPMDGDKDYPQAPFCTVYTPQEMVKEYGDGAMMASGLIVAGLEAFDNNLWAACDAALGITNPIEDMEPIDEPVMPEKNGYTQKQWNEKLVEFTKTHAQYYEYMEIYEQNEAKKDWIRRCKQFADRYVNSDVRKCTYLLKDVHNWKLWCDLKREYKDIDWSQAVEEKAHKIDVTSLAGATCNGNKCETGALGESIAKKQEETKKQAVAE